MNNNSIHIPARITEEGLRSQLLADYEQAVVHLAMNRCESAHTLLFAWVELLPKEVPPPVDDYCDQWKGGRLGNDSQNHIYVRHAVVGIAWALDWYLQCRSGRIAWPRWPHDEGFSRPPTDIERVLKSYAFSEEPKWPRLVTHSEETTALPFVGSVMPCPRVHHLLAAEPMDLTVLWADAERERAIAFLSERLHFDIDLHPELWGSVHLVAPNPVYSVLRSRLQPRPDGDTVLLRLRPRAGVSVQGVVVRFQERAPWGPNETRVVPATSGIIRMDFDHVVGSVSEEVLDSERGFLLVGDTSAAFARTIQMGIHLGRTVKVNTRNPDHSFEATRSGEEQMSIVGSPAVVGPAWRRLSEAWFVRQSRSQAKNGGGQEWFRGQHPRAWRALVDRIKRAHNAVMLVDPYFGPDELPLVEAVGFSRVGVRVLSARTLEERYPDNGLWSGFLRELQGRRAALPHNSVEVRVLAKNSLHDRFLVVDGKVWSLGGSCNKLGERGSLLYELRDAPSMQGILEALWAEGRPLEELAEGEEA